jgi:hypothetical protein
MEVIETLQSATVSLSLRNCAVKDLVQQERVQRVARRDQNILVAV